ncbi:MAG: GIY-YIG nuclease family protein [Candidatus Doudnabacteria bacterium]
MNKKFYYVYILANKSNSVLYIGSTSDIKTRLYLHKSKAIKGFTAKYNVTKLVYIEMFSDPYSMVVRERQLKGWTRKKKERLICVTNPLWKEVEI